MVDSISEEVEIDASQGSCLALLFFRSASIISEILTSA